MVKYIRRLNELKNKKGKDKTMKRLLSLVLVFCMIFSCFVTTDIFTVKTQAATNDYGLVDDVQNGQILQCFNWSFNNIKNNMAKIAEQGFSAIQTSPIQASKESTKKAGAHVPIRSGFIINR